MILWGKRYFVVVMAVLTAFFVALVRVFRLGKKTERQKQTETIVKRAITRLEIENEVNKKSNADVRSDLSQWVRK
ncbi:hypothetical protein AT246_06160 [Bartonella henselae]|uniref:Uncharacterized protein n=1 Tax=Bartonella henselae TaxID=38323 RepID=X5LZS3_BARHN|nr:hypothetical protein [Bartonella henselae]MDM9997217.1 hypothetical protein [Bartonella henselae]OLL49280.1 hypothetical protein AT243_04005 [Bartonella henselae]OLL49444.1 hypothetical protein AT247_00775 [Bartonella henselae]OLL50975.1 hypothetical protein AT241_06880 [Bartonella henselae]OLL58346.1 hypothetical protein AT246_06160 [Bartonella henselae]